MRASRIVRAALVVSVAAACARNSARPELSPRQVDVRLVSDEADAARSVLDIRARGATPERADWDRLFASGGYQHLQEREAAMGRAFTDSAFRAFLMSDAQRQRAAELGRTLEGLERVDVTAAAARALAYLPAATPLRARLYVEIKPATNSFVFTGRDSTPSIFLYVRPDETPAQLENTLAHELHHIGLNTACPEPTFPLATPAQAMLLLYLGGFGEGQAMLAAAGSPAVHPHAADADTIRARWDRDVAHAAADIAEQSRWVASVLDGRTTSADSVQRTAVSYYGTQGPWYTVGWLMAATIERQLGRATLIGSLCEPTRFIALYNDAAKRENEQGAALPMWDGVLVTRLLALRASAQRD